MLIQFKRVAHYAGRKRDMRLHITEFIYLYEGTAFIKRDLKNRFGFKYFTCSNVSVPLQTALAAEENLAEGHLSLVEQANNKAISLMYPVGSPRPEVSRAER
jgi:hypothetical protein